MFRTRPQFDGALAVVALFHRQITDALACICALPFVPFDIAVVFVAHFFPQPKITSAHAAYHGSSLPLITLVTVTLPFGCWTEMFWLTGRPLLVSYIVLVVMAFPSIVRK